MSVKLAFVTLACESASNLDPWRTRHNALHLKAFRGKGGGHGWTPIGHTRYK
jgi:hypothetical protein